MRRDRHQPVPVAVLDASAILALTLGERGANVVAAAVRRAAVASVVNVAEVLTKAVERGLEAEREARTIAEHQIEVVPLLPDDAEPIAKLQAVARERDVSLSLGDRVCLALASRLRLPALTADHAWGRLGLPNVEVRLIR